MYKVSSEIYKETNFQPVKGSDGKVVSKFKFHYPPTTKIDVDGDHIVSRRQESSSHLLKDVAEIEIEHSEATELRLVGLQVWRGALLLADFFFHCHQLFRDQQILELGAGVGLTSIAAAIHVRSVICTDVDIGGILNLIRANVARNSHLLTGEVHVLEFDFMKKTSEYPPELLQAIDESDTVVAADVIYDDTLTEAFLNVIDYTFKREKVSSKRKIIYVALEKRYVFTISEMDAVAPMYEHFLQRAENKSWHLENVPLDFPQCFEYERCNQLVLLRLTSGRQ